MIFNILKDFFKFYLAFIFIFFLGRVILFIIYYERIVEANVNHWFSFLIGLQMDTISTCIILVIPTILLFLSPKIFEKYVRKFLRMYFLVFLLLAIYIENITLPFIAEFDVNQSKN